MTLPVMFTENLDTKPINDSSAINETRKPEHDDSI